MQIILFGIAKALQRFLILLVVFPTLAILCTPVILFRAGVLAARNKQAFRHAVADGYDFIWSLWSQVL